MNVRTLAVFAVAASCGGCTLVKPVVGAFTGPVIIAGHSTGDFGCWCGDGRAFVAALVVCAAVGAGAGLVTGVISDVRALQGCAEPAHNWWDPFATNGSAR